MTGGAGYIGSHLCKELSKRGYRPITYDNLTSGTAAFAKWGPLVEGDILDRDKLLSVMKSERVEGVFHLAGLIDARASVLEKEAYHKNNGEGTRCVAEAMAACGAPRMVFASTCALYGHPKSVPITEKEALNPLSPYAQSKSLAEAFVEGVSLRFFNAAGADLEGETGENHRVETHLIPRAIEVALGKRSHLEVFGDGASVRDYVHVVDLAAALCDAYEAEARGIYNVGSGRGFSVLEVARELERQTGKKIPLRFREKLTFEPEILIADSQKAQKELHLNLKYSNLETIIETALRWHTSL